MGQPIIGQQVNGSRLSPLFPSSTLHPTDYTPNRFNSLSKPYSSMPLSFLLFAIAKVSPCLMQTMLKFYCSIVHALWVQHAPHLLTSIRRVCMHGITMCSTGFSKQSRRVCMHLDPSFGNNIMAHPPEGSEGLSFNKRTHVLSLEAVLSVMQSQNYFLDVR